MSFEEIIHQANEAYGDGLVLSYFREPDQNHGDGLAKFIVEELRETYDKDATPEAQLYEASRVMNSAAQQCERISNMFFELARRQR